MRGRSEAVEGEGTGCDSCRWLRFGVFSLDGRALGLEYSGSSALR